MTLGLSLRSFVAVGDKWTLALCSGRRRVTSARAFIQFVEWFLQFRKSVASKFNLLQVASAVTRLRFSALKSSLFLIDFPLAHADFGVIDVSLIFQSSRRRSRKHFPISQTCRSARTEIKTPRAKLSQRIERHNPHGRKTFFLMKVACCENLSTSLRRNWLCDRIFRVCL